MATYAKSDDTAGSREDAVKLPECVTSLSVTGQGAHKCQSENSHSPKLLKRPKSVQSRSSGNQCVCGRTTAQRTSELQVCHQRHHTSPGCLDNPKRKTFKFHLQKRSNTLETAKPLSNLNKSYSKLKSVRQKADEIMKSKRIFIVRGPYKVVRRGLRSRGWVEKDHHRKVDPKADRTVLETEEDSDADLSSPEEESSDEEYSDEEEYTMLVCGACTNSGRGMYPSEVEYIRMYIHSYFICTYIYMYVYICSPGQCVIQFLTSFGL